MPTFPNSVYVGTNHGYEFQQAAFAAGVHWRDTGDHGYMRSRFAGRTGFLLFDDERDGTRKMLWGSSRKDDSDVEWVPGDPIPGAKRVKHQNRFLLLLNG